jgi:Phage Connector (GP10)
MKALDLGVHPDTVERSHVVAMRLWNEALTAMGVQAGAQEKEERLTDDEVQAIRGAVESIRRRTLTPRVQGAALINRRYFGGAEIVKVIDQW